MAGVRALLSANPERAATARIAHMRVREDLRTARAVIGGLITSTLLTLVVVPVAYTYFDDVGAWVKRHLVSSRRQHEIDVELDKSGMRPESVWGD